MGSEEEAEWLLTMTCSRNYDGQFVAVELAEEQSLEHLEAFSQRLQKMHEERVKGTEFCHCKEKVK